MRVFTWFAFLGLVLASSTAGVAGPVCSAYQQRVAPNSPQCFEAATDLQDDDIVYGVQGAGPSRSNQSVKIPVSQLRADAAAAAPVQSVAGRDGDVALSTTDISGLGTIATQSAASVAITGGTISGADVSGAVATATGGTTARTHATRFADRINVKDYGATLDGSTDDSAAWNAAVTRANTLSAAGTRVCIYMPAGISRIVTAPPQFSGAGCLLGDGPHKSFVLIDPALSGAVFAWGEAWSTGSYSHTGNTIDFTTETAGPYIQGFTFVGNRTAAAEQNVLVFYDRADYVLVRDVEFYYVPGRAIWSGVTQIKSQSYMRESEFWNIRAFMCGNATTSAPAIEFNSVGGSGTDATNEVNLHDVNIFASYNKGLWIHNAGSGTVRLIRINGLRIEGASGWTSPGGDSLVIGDPTTTGLVRDITVTGFDGEMGYPSYATVRIQAGASSVAPFNINIDGEIGSGRGDGVVIGAGSRIRLRLFGNSVSGTQLTVGPSTLVTGPIDIDANGNEAYWTYSIDSTSLQYVSAAVRRTGNPALASANGTSAGGVVANVHDGSTAGGNPIGPNAVDLQQIRTANTQVPQAQYSAILGGRLNTVGASGTGSVVVGGSGHVLNAPYSRAAGNSAGDHARTVFDVYAGGQFSGAGDAQAFRTVMRGSVATAAAFRLTADNNAAGSTNCLNMLDNYGATFRIALHVRDGTTAGNEYSWVMPNAMLTRGSGAASTTLTLGTPLTLSQGSTLSGITVAATADTTNGCLQLQITPPGGNTHTIHAVAEISGVEVK